MINPEGAQPKLVHQTRDKVHISKILNYELDAYGIPDKWDSLDEYLNVTKVLTVHNETSQLPTDISGTPELIKETKVLIQKYKEIFRTTVSTEPADVPPMEIKVDRQKWNSLKGNMGVSPRVQTPIKNEEIKRQIDKMIEMNVIKVSDANRYSQVHLQQKPTPAGEKQKWRFCIDYILLNSCCEGEAWNLPNIQQMLQRIGTHRPKFFAVIDLTSGYHQVPLRKTSQIFTAFISFMGLHQWSRVPMGLKGAAGYFQRILATIVLIGLIYHICELYIDDIVVHAQDAKTYLSNLEQVFQRLKKHKITLNPEKCKFGLQSIEYVGHTIDETGLSFSPQKLDEVLAIEPPTYAKGLRSFLGLASYFRDHIQNLASISKPLQDMITNYEVRRKLVWTPEGTKAFQLVKDAIRKCPKLFFIDEQAPVYLHTDASDYGIGAYLFQTVDEKEIPIAFMSKSLTTDEIKWSTIEKECYAIVIALHKFEYLLRDRKFTLRTDHDNLTYMNDPPSPKVRRWKISIQGFDFDIEYIKGELNVAADGFSRLLPITVEVSCLLKGLKLPRDIYKMISSVHNTVVGHHKVERTIAKLKTQNLQWPQMRDHVRKFIDNCVCCQKMNYLRIPIHTHPFTLGTHRPMEVFHMDTLYMGIQDDNKAQYLLVLIDSCSRWIELYPITDLLAETAAEKIAEHIGRFGHPAQILSDNGSQFVNKLFEDLYALTGIHRLNTTPDSSEENGIVERANKEILRHVRSILFDKSIHKQWTKVIPMVQRILNSQKSTVTGCTPADLVLINANNLERYIYMNPISNSNDNNLSKWVSDRLILQKKVLEVAQSKLQEKEEEKLKQSSTQPTEYTVGTYVLLRSPEGDMIKGMSKLKLPLRGPMLVTQFQNDQYTVQDITTGKESKVHVSRLLPFYYDESYEDPYQIAAKDTDEEEVDFILDHTSTKYKKDMDFLVRWTGQGPTEDRWLPWSQLYNNTRLHKYLYDNGMKKLIPKPFKKQEYH